MFTKTRGWVLRQVDDVLSPLTGLQVAVTHVAPYSSYAPWLPHQVLTLRQAVDAYTIDAAYACHAEETTGSIAVGKDADLIVLDKDIFRLQSNDISTARIVSTTIKGTTVYQT
jgi:predicted amidohydrolase YtcJ